MCYYPVGDPECAKPYFIYYDASGPKHLQRDTVLLEVAPRVAARIMLMNGFLPLT